MPSLLWQEAERFHPRPRCCSSSVVEHSLGKGEVESSILSCSTIFPKRFQLLRGRSLPFPPLLDLEQNLKDASKLGEISGSMFAIRSADWQPRLERRLQNRQPLRPACIKEGRRASNCSGYRLDDFIFLFGGKRRAAKSSSTRAATHPDPSISQFCVDAEFKRTIDTRAVLAQGRAAAGEIDGDGRPSDDDGRQRAVEGRRRSVPLLTAANDPTDTLSDDVQPSRTSKRGPLDRINLKTILAVETFEFLLQEVLRAKRATIRVTIWPRDQRGWVTVRAVSVLTSTSTKGLGPANQPLGATTMSGADDATARPDRRCRAFAPSPIRLRCLRRLPCLRRKWHAHAMATQEENGLLQSVT